MSRGVASSVTGLAVAATLITLTAWLATVTLPERIEPAPIPSIEAVNYGGRIIITGPLIPGLAVYPTCRSSDDGERWRVEVLGDTYEARRRKAGSDP